MIVEPTDDKNVNNRINPKHKDYNKAFHEQYKKLDADPNAIYKFNKVERNGDKLGEVTCSGTNEKGQDLININYSYNSTSLLSKESILLEETFHATQYMNGDFGFQLQDGAYKAFGVDLHDEAAAQVFAAQNVQGMKTPMERAMLKAFNNGGLTGTVDFMGTRIGKQGYSGLDRGPVSAEAMFRQYNGSYSGSLYNSNGTSAIPGIIMRKP